MKNFKLLVVAIASFICSSSIHAQTRLESGDIAGLKGVTSVNLVYDYSKMGVGSFDNEQDYLKKKEEDSKKDPAKFEKFKEGWYSSRKSRYEPKFEELFNKTGEKAGIYGKNNGTDGQVTLKVITEYTEPGFNAGVVRKDASVNFKCVFISKDGKDIAVYSIRNVPGGSAMGYDFDAGSRIQESYAKAAKMLVKDVTKRLKKIK